MRSVIATNHFFRTDFPRHFFDLNWCMSSFFRAIHEAFNHQKIQESAVIWWARSGANRDDSGAVPRASTCAATIARISADSSRWHGRTQKGVGWGPRKMRM